MYNSPVKTNDELRAKLNDMLSNDFESNIVSAFASYIEDEILDDRTNERIADFYLEAKAAYIDAIASIIMYPDSLDYVDEM